jgi:Fic family protein
MSNSIEKDKLFKLAEVITPVSLLFLQKIGEYKGRQLIYSNQQIDYLNRLQIEAIKDNTFASNKIDGIEIDKKLFNELFEEVTDPNTSVESEIIRYVKVLNLINSHYETLEVTPDLILQFHRNLFRYKPGHGGKWKPLDNVIEHNVDNGEKNTVFIPVSADNTTEYINELCLSYNSLIHDPEVVDLIIIAAFILDFLCIHPFTFGNGRVARLLTQLLLYKQNYQVARYCSLDQILLSNKQKYLCVLNKSSQGWHESRHDLSSWVEFFLWVIYTGYFKLDKQMFNIKNKKGAKAQQIKMVIDMLSASFQVSEIAEKCPGIARPTINKVLQELRDLNLISSKSRGRDAIWIKHY